MVVRSMSANITWDTKFFKTVNHESLRKVSIETFLRPFRDMMIKTAGLTVSRIKIGAGPLARPTIYSLVIKGRNL